MPKRTEFWQRISTLLFAILAGIAGMVFVGLIVVSVRLVQIRADLSELRNETLPRLVKLAQLSQEASATSSIAPALSTNPSRSEFDTLLSRIRDKETSQLELIDELENLSSDPDATSSLRRNGDLLIANQATLTDVVREQMDIDRNLENHVDLLGQILARNSKAAPSSNNDSNIRASAGTERIALIANQAALQLINMLIDSNGARFARNRNLVDASMERLGRLLETQGIPLPDGVDDRKTIPAARELFDHWVASRLVLVKDKTDELANTFKIKALAEENSLLATRLLSAASSEFWRATATLEADIRVVNGTAQFTLATISVVITTCSVGLFLIWFVLHRRVFHRLDRMRDELGEFAESRKLASADAVPDEIGAISESLTHYMEVINQRETELSTKTRMLEQLSSQLAKYLSPQVYESIFSGTQKVRIASVRKKLTIFFSDIVDFTETADRLESEELTELLNQYLTEMSQIALENGATIDKYVGDAIMVFFGDPETRGVQCDAIACVKMAIAMRDRLRWLAAKWRAAGIERPLQARIGIHTGYCTVGNFGSEDRMDYTIVGSAVNIASRLETLAAPGSILISFETFANVKSVVKCVEHGQVEVKGLGHTVTTYEVVDSFSDLTDVGLRFDEQHEHMLLEINADAMTSVDRNKAEKALERALSFLRQM